MPSLFVVITKTERPQLCVSQQSLPDTLSNLRCWPYSHTHQLFVFEARALPTNAYGSNQYGQPRGCVELAMAAHIDADDKCENYHTALGFELDQLPPEQAILNAQRAIDYLERKLLRYSAPDEPEKGETTGT